jgi:hypothetical protein
MARTVVLVVAAMAATVPVVSTAAIDLMGFNFQEYLQQCCCRR